MYFKLNHTICIFFQEADIAIGPLAITLKRTEVVDFSMAYMNSDNSFIYKAITKIQPDLLIVWKAFTLLVNIYWM